MVNIKSLGTKDIPLKLAKRITEEASQLWKSGEYMQKVTPITQELLKFWNPNGIFADERNINFHDGQWQAILNVIYVHEILKLKSVGEIYTQIYPELLAQMELLDLKRDKYEHPKYCVKMATGTGKTWVLDALLIWQYLNSKYEENESGEYSRNFRSSCVMGVTFCMKSPDFHNSPASSVILFASFNGISLVPRDFMFTIN